MPRSFRLNDGDSRARADRQVRERLDVATDFGVSPLRSCRCRSRRAVHWIDASRMARSSARHAASRLGSRPTRSPSRSASVATSRVPSRGQLKRANRRPGSRAISNARRRTVALSQSGVRRQKSPALDEIRSRKPTARPPRHAKAERHTVMLPVRKDLARGLQCDFHTHVYAPLPCPAPVTMPAPASTHRRLSLRSDRMSAQLWPDQEFSRARSVLLP